MPAESQFGMWVLVAFAAFASSVAYRLWRQRRSVFDDDFSDSDRRTAGAAVFYLVIPAIVALKLGLQLTVASALGAQAPAANYSLYWSYVSAEFMESVQATPQSIWRLLAVPISGQALLSLVGLWAIMHTLRHPRNAAWNFARIEVARLCLGLAWLFYPLGSWLGGTGDYAQIQAVLLQVGGDAARATPVAYGLFLAGLWWLWRKAPWRRHYVRLATPVFDRMQRARQRLALDPNDVEALCILGRSMLATDELEPALPPLRRAAALAPDQPRTQLLLALGLLRNRQPLEASAVLRRAGERLIQKPRLTQEERQLEYEITLTLAHARLAFGDAEGALLTAEAGLALGRTDARAILTHSDALVAAGRAQEAEARLLAALEEAQGLFAHEIRRRLASLARSR